MSRTKRGVAYRHYWGGTKEDAKKWAEEFSDSRYHGYFERNYLLHGTDSRNWSPRRKKYIFNRTHRTGRSVARDQLRPHIVLSEDYDFDDARYRRKYKSAWWEIY
jgi:hypothetical protein